MLHEAFSNEKRSANNGIITAEIMPIEFRDPRVENPLDLRKDRGTKKIPKTCKTP